MDFPGGSGHKTSVYNVGDSGSIPGWGRSPWRRKWQSTPVLLPGKPMDRGAWWATVHGVTKSRTWLSNFTFMLTFMYRCESWTVKEAEYWRTATFKLCCWRRFLRVLWTARRSNQSILKEINPECSLEGSMLKLKLYFGHLMGRADPLGKDPDAGKD